MAAIGSRAANVVDRARGVRDEVGEVGARVDRRGHERRHRPRRAVRRPELTAFPVGEDGERADGDHHRVPRPDLHECLRLAARVDPDRQHELVLRQSVPLRAEEELRQRQRAHPADAGDLDDRVLHQERWVRVAGGRGCAEIAADRAAVPDLRRADRARGLCERGQELGERRTHRLGVRQ